MNLSRPEEALADPGAVAVLVALARADADLPVEGLGGRTGLPAEALGAAVGAVLAAGLVHRVGSALRLNREHVLAMAVEQLAGARGRVPDRLRMHLGTWDPAPAWAAVAGSVARGEAGHDDIDLLLVAPAGADDDPRWAAQLAAIRADAEAWTGNPLHVITLAAVPDTGHGTMVLVAADDNRTDRG